MMRPETSATSFISVVVLTTSCAFRAPEQRPLLQLVASNSVAQAVGDNGALACASLTDRNTGQRFVFLSAYLPDPGSCLISAATEPTVVVSRSTRTVLVQWMFDESRPRMVRPPLSAMTRAGSDASPWVFVQSIEVPDAAHELSRGSEWTLSCQVDVFPTCPTDWKDYRSGGRSAEHGGHVGDERLRSAHAALRSAAVRLPGHPAAL